MDSLKALEEALDEGPVSLDERKKLLALVKEVISECGLKEVSAFPLGRAYYILGEHQRARECLDKSCDPASVLWRGYSLFDEAEYLGAREAFLIALADLELADSCKAKVSELVICCSFHLDPGKVKVEDLRRLRLERGRVEEWFVPVPRELARTLFEVRSEIDSRIWKIALALFGIDFLMEDVWPGGRSEVKAILTGLIEGFIQAELEVS